MRSSAALPRPLHASVRGPWLHLLSQTMDLAGPDAQFLRHGERPWSSATFSGARHTLVLSFDGEDAAEHAEAFAAALPDHEFTIPGQLVADAVIAAVERDNRQPSQVRVEAEFLLLVDA